VRNLKIKQPTFGTKVTDTLEGNLTVIIINSNIIIKKPCWFETLPLGFLCDQMHHALKSHTLYFMVNNLSKINFIQFISRKLSHV